MQMGNISTLFRLPICPFLRKSLHFVPFSLSRLVANPLLFTPKNPLLDPKIPLFNGYFALFRHVFHGSRRLCLYHWGVFLCFLYRVQQHFSLRFAPFYLAFCTKTHCIQHQNALHFAPKRTAFSGILHYILLQTAQKLVQMAASSNKYSFRCIHMLTPFCIKTNLRENRFFAAKCGLVSRKGTYNVKFFTKNITTVDKLTSWWAQPSFHSFKLTSWWVQSSFHLFQLTR